MRNKQEKITGNIDWITVLLYALLVGIGWISMYSAVYNDDSHNIFNTNFNSGKQFQWIVFCSVVALIILVIDSRFYTAFAYYIYGFFLIVLVAVMFVGVEVKGQRNWVRFGGFQLQPSELVKFTTSLAVAKFLSTLNIDIRKWNDKLKIFAIVAIPMVIILIQGDAGSAIVFVAFSLVLFREGLESYFLIIGGSVILLSVMALVINKFIIIGILFAIGAFIGYFNFRNFRFLYFLFGIWLVASMYVLTVDYAFSKLKGHQKDRINVLLGKGGNDWNIRQSIIAIGSGGLTGKGFLKGTQTKLKFVPEQSTDFIFSSIGEEWGFAGGAAIIIIFMAFFLRLLFLAERQRSKFSRVYGYCVACILFFHFLVNMGMAIGVAPVIGIPLPFISYGGSSLLSFTILLFIFIRLDGQRLEMLR